MIKNTMLIAIPIPVAPPMNGIAGVGVGVTVAVGTGVLVAVRVGVSIGVGVGVQVLVTVGVAEGVGVFAGGSGCSNVGVRITPVETAPVGTAVA
jgi:hypothetical protein